MQPRMKHVSRADTTKYLPWRHAEVLSSQLSLALGDELLKLNGGENQENLRPENAVYTTLYNIITEGYALDATQDEINHAIMACAALAIDQLAIISKIHTQGLRDIVRKRYVEEYQCSNGRDTNSLSADYVRLIMRVLLCTKVKKIQIDGAGIDSEIARVLAQYPHLEELRVSATGQQGVLALLENQGLTSLKMNYR